MKESVYEITHCQNCDEYQKDTGKLKQLGELKVCPKCYNKLENARAKKAQVSFDFAGQQNSLF